VGARKIADCWAGAASPMSRCKNVACCPRTHSTGRTASCTADGKSSPTCRRNWQRRASRGGCASSARWKSLPARRRVTGLGRGQDQGPQGMEVNIAVGDGGRKETGRGRKLLQKHAEAGQPRSRTRGSVVTGDHIEEHGIRPVNDPDLVSRNRVNTDCQGLALTSLSVPFSSSCGSPRTPSSGVCEGHMARFPKRSTSLRPCATTPSATSIRFLTVPEIRNRPKTRNGRAPQRSPAVSGHPAQPWWWCYS